MLGDTNIDHNKTSTDPEINHYFNCLECLGCTNLIETPTRVTKKSQTIIDHCYTNNVQEVKAEVMISDISDHYVITAKSLETFNANKIERPRVRVFSEETPTQYFNLLQNRLQNYQISTCVDQNFEHLIDSMNELANQCFPLKKASRKAFKKNLG